MPLESVPIVGEKVLIVTYANGKDLLRMLPYVNLDEKSEGNVISVVVVVSIYVVI